MNDYVKYDKINDLLPKNEKKESYDFIGLMNFIIYEDEQKMKSLDMHEIGDINKLEGRLEALNQILNIYKRDFNDEKLF